MKVISKKEFENLVITEARKVHNQFLRVGQFWPIQMCKSQVRKVLMNQYKISK